MDDGNKVGNVNAEQQSVVKIQSMKANENGLQAAEEHAINDSEKKSGPVGTVNSTSFTVGDKESTVGQNNNG